MAWTVVPNLNELLAQMNARFPKRDKASDGSIGDTSHGARASSHNPDRSGSPEFKDGDARDEVRARDFDKDLKDVHGVTMEQVVQHWVKNARAGKLPWVRYIIFNKRIWHKRDNYKTRKYTGSNTHEKHVHVNSDFSQFADTVTKTDWLLKDFGVPKPKPPIQTDLVKRLQKLVKMAETGKWDSKMDSTMQLMHEACQMITVDLDIKKLQTVIGVKADGVWGTQSAAALPVWIKEFQKVMGLVVDGKWGPKTEAAYLALRKRNYN